MFWAGIKDDCVFATLTQLSTAPLTSYFATQIADIKIGKKFVIHLVGAELQFEADILDIWETFFLHLAHRLIELTIVFCGPELNAENIPLNIISRIRFVNRKIFNSIGNAKICFFFSLFFLIECVEYVVKIAELLNLTFNVPNSIMIMQKAVHI